MLVMTVGGSYSVYQSLQNKKMSDTMLENLEALADGESSSSDCNTYCVPDNRCICLLSWGGGIDGITCPGYRAR